MKTCKNGHVYHFICLGCFAQKTNKCVVKISNRYKNKIKLKNKLKQIEKRRSDLYAVWLAIPHKYFDFEYFVAIDGMPAENGDLRGLAKLYKEAEELI